MKKDTIIKLVAGTIGLLVVLAIVTAEDTGNSKIDVVREKAADAETVEELMTVVAEFDSLKAEYPKQVAYIDSMVAVDVPKWKDKILAREKENVLYNCFYNAQEHVRQKMKNPDGAKFSAYTSDDSKCWEEGGVVYAQFWAEGTNSFNAVIRNRYQVKIRQKGDKYFILEARTY